MKYTLKDLIIGEVMVFNDLYDLETEAERRFDYHTYQVKYPQPVVILKESKNLYVITRLAYKTSD